MKKSILSIAAFAALAPAMQSQSLKVVNVPDTTSASKVNIVAVTSPTATAQINGEAVKVYKTGSFGAPVELQMGDNKIDISVTEGTESKSQTVNVYRKEKTPQKSQAAPQDIMYSTPYVGATKENAFLVYGNGDDRLGGSKMGFIAKDIPMKVVGENGELYKVQLSDHRYAYIEKIYIDQAQPQELAPVNTGSWSVTNQGSSDRISIALPRRLPYRSWTLIDPSTICIELFGAMDNSNWITQHGPLGIIDYVYFEQPESDVYKVVIRLKEKNCWGYAIDYSGNTLRIDVRHKPSLKLKDLTIGLDAGHGGAGSSGAVSPSGMKESDINLDIIMRLRDLLEKSGAKVVLTRDSDTGLTMRQRKEIWRDAKVDIAISVHNNAGGSPYQAMGTSVYYKHLFDRPLAECMHASMLQLGVADYGLTGNFNFALNGPAEYPNVLVEALFMSSLIDEEMLADPDMRQQIAKQIFKGLATYLEQNK